MNDCPPKNKFSNTAYHHGDLAPALVAAGTEILQEIGIDGLSLRAVAAKVGVSQSAPYTHFKNKKELLRAIAASGFQQLSSSIKESCSPDSSLQDTVLNYCVAYVEFAINNPDIYRLMFAQIDPNGRKDHKRELASKADILSKEAKNTYKLLYLANQSLYHDKEKSTRYSLGLWGLVHGLASLITEDMIKIPDTGHHDFIKELVAGQVIGVSELN